MRPLRHHFHHIDLRHRAEELLKVGRVVARDMRQDRRLKEAPVTLHRFATVMQRRAVFHRLVDLCGQRFQRILRGQRPQGGALVQRIANLHLLKRLGEFREEGIRNLLMQDETLRRRTDLAGVIESGIHARLHGLLQIGIIQHHKDVITAQLQGRFFDVLRRLRRDHATRFSEPVSAAPCTRSSAMMFAT